jgi:two-component system heavy metal sensor histidine kinase CusS
LSLRLALWSAATSSLIAVAVGAAGIVATDMELRSIDEQVLLKRALTVGELLQSPSAAAEWLGHEVSEDLEGPRRVFIRVLDPAGGVAAETPGMSEVAPDRLFPQPRPIQEQARPVAESRVGLRLMSLRAPAQAWGEGAEAVIQVGVDTRIDDALRERVHALTLGLSMLAILASSLAAAGIAARLLGPLRRMAREAEGLRLGAGGQRLTVADLDQELREVGQAFNGVLERLERANQRLKRYSDDVAHEIKTPLSRMLLRSEIALREPRSAGEYRETLEKQADECASLSRLAQRLLFIAKAENQRLPLDLQPLALARDIEVMRGFFEAGATDAGLSLTVSADDSVICADRTLFQQAIGNLLANAIAYTKAGTVTVTARACSGGAEIIVADTGVGIAAEALPHIFDRFYQADRVAGGTGVGLGLAITKSIVELHGGRIIVASETGKGVTVETWWPSRLGERGACDRNAEPASEEVGKPSD